jgi:hypothetical protein
MKTLSKKQLAYKALLDEVATFDDKDVREILEKKEPKKTYFTESKRHLYFGFDGSCFDHDRFVCAECSISARGECPSAKEEGFIEYW